MRNFKKVLILIVMLMLCITPTKLNVVNAGATYRAMCVLEGNTLQVLNEYNSTAKLAMASTTKIITAIVAIENCEDFNKTVTVADESVGIEGTSIYLRKNEQITMDNLLYGLILASGNDAAMALAYEIGGSEENFVNMMNEFVKRVGANNTHLANPHGLDAKDHYTTAYDLALITAYALNNDKFKEVVSTKTKVFGGGEYQTRYLRNKDKLLFSQEGCIGVKTGFTDNAGRCLVNACDRDGMRVISVVLNCGPMFEECDRLTEQALKYYTTKQFVAPYNFVGVVPVTDGDKTEVSVATLNGFTKTILKSEEDNYKVEYNLSSGLVAPVTTETVVGDVKVYYNDKIIYAADLYSIDECKNIDIKHKIDNIIENWFN